MAAGESRCARGGARAVSAGSPGGGGGGEPARTPSPKSRGGGAARRCAWAVKFGSCTCGFACCVWGGEGGPSPPELGSDPGPQSHCRPLGVTSSPPFLDPVRPGRTAAGQRATPCWRATSASRGCPLRKPPQLVSIQGRRRGARAPGVAAAASGTFGDSGFPGTKGHARGRRQGPRLRWRGPSPARFWGWGLTLSAAGHWGHSQTN